MKSARIVCFPISPKDHERARRFEHTVDFAEWLNRKFKELLDELEDIADMLEKDEYEG